MNARASVGWQTALADLSLILFMITAAAVTRQPSAAAADPAKVAPSPGSAPSPQSEPLAVYVDAPGMPPLARWLDEQAVDPRQQLTITAHYGAGQDAQARALAAATRLLYEAGKAGRAARIVVEPGEGPSRVVIAFDTPAENAPSGTGGDTRPNRPNKVAQGLLHAGQS